MADTRYSVKELDDLRSVVEHKWLFGAYSPTSRSGISRSYNDADKTKSVEEIVRTHMLAGHTAQELIESEQPK